ncbi:cilia- and flagella-associated protein 161 isoform X2 [Sphaerodactylus townsendi]|uniref:cilia- and flagella-associated protein 161 isoform X2 n=1 Tax=Sphaerodactylus townsendi TaxID=933632 RepID=UPI0020266AE6|nr:cilia- and flagella-associated protein 161 isoform X2 [Sphaerodactylus townsendi]
MFNFNLRTSRSGREYSPGVLIANWNEDVYLEEEQLSISKDGFLHFGDTVLLVSPDEKSAMESSPCERGNLSLAVTPDEMSIHALDALPSPCGVSAIRLTDPIGRNAFQILSTEGASMGDPLRFGQNFGLGATGGFHDRMLFLASDHKTFENKAKKSLLQAVSLTDELSYLASWQVTYLDPQLRLEYEGFPVPANNTKILITHCHTNQALAVPRTFWMRTYFGKEYEVVCNTYLDSHKAEEDKNYWIMVTGNPSDGSTTMFDRPPPPSEVTREKSSEVQTAT